jgi:hypothetical protein
MKSVFVDLAHQADVTNFRLCCPSFVFFNGNSLNVESITPPLAVYRWSATARSAPDQPLSSTTAITPTTNPTFLMFDNFSLKSSIASPVLTATTPTLYIGYS